MASRRRAVAPAVEPAWFEHLSDAALRESAGDKVFERGLAYWRQDRVELLHDDGRSARFEAEGSEVYAVSLRFEEPGLASDCECPHAADGFLCKHVVAAALLWRQHLGGAAPTSAAEAEPDGRAEVQRERLAKAARTRAANALALQDFLTRQPADALAQRLWEHAQLSRDLMAELKAWAAQDGAANDPKALRKAVDELLKTSRRLPPERREVKAWVLRAQKAAALLRAALPAQGAEVRGIAESAIHRAGELQSHLAELMPEVGDALDAFVTVLLAALQAVPPPASWAEHLLKLQLEPEAEVWIDPRLAGALGAEAGRHYRRRLEAAWAAAPAPAREGYRDYDSRRGRLRRLMIAELDRQEDLPACLAFQQRSAAHAFEFSELIDWCEVHGRTREALQIAQAAVRRFPEDRHLEDQLLQAYARDGWDEEALAIRWRRFEENPAPQLYRPLMDAGRAAGADLAALKRKAHAVAKALEDKELESTVASLKRFNPWGHVAARDVTRRVALYFIDGEIDDAIELAQAPHSCDLDLLEAMAESLDARRDADAFALLRRCFETRLQTDKSPYREPLRLLAKALKRLKPKPAREFLAQVHETYRTKRVFIEGLSRLAPPDA